MKERLLDSKWRSICLSVFLAIIFWLYVRAELDPTQPGVLRSVPIELTGEGILTSQGLAVADVSHDYVDLRVEAPTSVLENLNRSDISVVVDVSKCVAGENKLYYTPKIPTNINIEGTVWVSQSPEMLTVKVEKLDSKVFPVEFRLHGSVTEGYQAGTAAVSPETINISGPVDQVSQIDRVVAVLESKELSEPYSGNLPVRLYNANGEELTDLEVTMESESVYVVLPVVVVKDIRLTVNFLSGGGATQDDVSYKIEPESITVSGTAEDMQEFDELSLGSIDLSKVIGEKDVSMPISLSPVFENVSGLSNAVVSVTVEGLSTRTLEVDNIVLSNIPYGYSVVSSTKARTVVIRGKEELLETIDPSQLKIVVDMSDISTVGTYQVPAKVYLNASDSVGVIGEYAVVVTISR